MAREKLNDLIEEFEKRSKKALSSNRDVWENDLESDLLYNVDIHVWRETGMGNTLQTVVGNKISIMTATCSYLNTLVDKGVCTKEELEEMLNYVGEGDDDEDE